MNQLINFKPVPEAVNVKKAFCVVNDEYILLFHYDTQILTYNKKTRTVEDIKPVSLSSIRAINQVSDHFYLNIDYKAELKRLTGKTLKEYRWY
jgi:hypothetical protein